MDHLVALPAGLSLPNPLHHLVSASSYADAPPIWLPSGSPAMDGCDVSLLPAGAEKLARILKNLEILEYRLHYENSLVPPTDREIVLYSLILRHVSISCFLFIQEQITPLKGLPRVRAQDGGQAAFKIDENLSSLCCEVLNKAEWCLPRNDDAIKEWRSSTLNNLSGEPDEFNKCSLGERMCAQPDDVQVVSEALECRARLSNYADHEDVLVDILQGLDDCWRRRSYAAPSTSEFGQYREIRRLLVSCRCCIGGKFMWLKNFGVPRSLSATLPFEDFEGGMYGVPEHYNFAVTGDLLRDSTRLLTECRNHPFDILALRRAANPKPERLPHDMAFVPVSNMDVDHCNDCSCVEKKTRLAHLQDIFHEMQNINRRPLTAADFRFYMLLLEHVESAIWHAENEPARCEKTQHSVVSEQARDPEDSRSRTQDQSVGVIISSLEHIKAHWLATRPTHAEYLCYRQILDVLFWKRHGSLQMSDFGVAPLQKEEIEDGIRRFLDETLKPIEGALRELELDNEAVTDWLKDSATMRVDASGGLQDAMERIDRAALMMFKRGIALDHMVFAISEVLGTLYADLENQCIDDLSEQVAIFLRVPRQ